MTLVSWRSGVDYHKASPMEAAKLIEEPVLLIHSQQDLSTASSQSVQIASNLNPARSSFHHTDWGGDHTEDVRINKERFQALINTFLAEHAPDFLTKKETAQLAE